MFFSIFTSVINAIILGVYCIISSQLINALKNQSQASIFNSRHKQQLTFWYSLPVVGIIIHFLCEILGSSFSIEMPLPNV